MTYEISKAAYQSRLAEMSAVIASGYASRAGDFGHHDLIAEHSFKIARLIMEHADIQPTLEG